MAQKKSEPPAVPAHHDCDFRDMLSRVGDKWSLLVIAMLEWACPDRRGRFSSLKRSIPGISQRMLTATVRHLERDGMLTRQILSGSAAARQVPADGTWQRADGSGPRSRLVVASELADDSRSA